MNSLTRTMIALFSPKRSWMKQVTAKTIKVDVFSGITNAAIVLPQSVAFAIVAGLPPQYGLFSAMIIPLIAAIWGSSMVMVSGPTVAVSAILYTTLIQHAEPGSAEYINLALCLTLMTGLVQLLAGLVRAGALITFVSHSVMTGFTAAVALLISVSQLSYILGIKVERAEGIISRLYTLFNSISSYNSTAILLSISTILMILIMQMFARKIPAYLIALVLGVLIGNLVDAEAKGIAMFSSIASIIPQFQIPQFDLHIVSTLLPGATTIAFVALLGAISIGRTFALRRHEKYNTDQEIIGQGLSNIVGGLCQSYAGSGSFTRSALNQKTGAATPLSAVFASFFLLLLLYFVAPFIDQLPVPVVAGIIFMVAFHLIDVKEILHIIKSSKRETLILVVTFLTGVITSLDVSVIAGTIVSLLVFIHRSANPKIAAATPAIHHGRRSLRGVLYWNLEPCPQISFLRIDGPIFFASTAKIEKQIRKYEQLFPKQKIKILYIKGVGDIDLAGADFLVSEIKASRQEGGDFHIVAIHQDVVSTLEKTEVLDVLGERHLHPDKSEAIAAAVELASDEICKTCQIRTFLECKHKQVPEGVSSTCIPPEILDIFSEQKK